MRHKLHPFNQQNDALFHDLLNARKYCWPVDLPSWPLQNYTDYYTLHSILNTFSTDAHQWHTVCGIVFPLTPDPHIQTRVLGAAKVGLGSIPAHCPTILVLPLSSEILCLPEPHSTHHKTLFTLIQFLLFVLPHYNLYDKQTAVRSL